MYRTSIRRVLGTGGGACIMVVKIMRICQFCSKWW